MVLYARRNARSKPAYPAEYIRDMLTPARCLNNPRLCRLQFHHKKGDRAGPSSGFRQNICKKGYFWSENFSTTRTLSPRTVIGMGTTLS